MSVVGVYNVLRLHIQKPLGESYFFFLQEPRDKFEPFDRWPAFVNQIVLNESSAVQEGNRKGHIKLCFHTW